MFQTVATSRHAVTCSPTLSPFVSQRDAYLMLLEQLEERNGDGGSSSGEEGIPCSGCQQLWIQSLGCVDKESSLGDQRGRRGGTMSRIRRMSS